ncbi:MAG: hypothetical protein WBC06_09350 [Chitinophagaceae bacterium]
MNKKLSLFLLFCVTTLMTLAQTKKIAFKSHSGSAENFQIALENNLFDIEESNFGLPPTKEIYTSTLDSVFFISDTMAVRVVSHFSTQTFPQKEKPVLLQQVRDTLYHHILFSQKHALDSIKKALKAGNEYENSMEKVVFVGYDNKKKKKTKRNEMIPVVTPVNPGNNGIGNAQAVNNESSVPFDKTALLMLGLVFLLSIIAGLAAWKFKQPKQKVALYSGN